MSCPPPPPKKYFRRQSGQMQAFQAEVAEILKATIAVAERVKTDPPPPALLKSLVPGAGTYSYVDEDGILEDDGCVQTLSADLLEDIVPEEK